MASAVARPHRLAEHQRPSSAAKNGEAPSMNVAFATEVCCSASTKPMKPPASANAAATPLPPASRKAPTSRPGWRSAMIRVSVSASASERNSTICQPLAASIRRISRPPMLQNTPASATSDDAAGVVRIDARAELRREARGTTRGLGREPRAAGSEIRGSWRPCARYKSGAPPPVQSDRELHLGRVRLSLCETRQTERTFLVMGGLGPVRDRSGLPLP